VSWPGRARKIGYSANWGKFKRYFSVVVIPHRQQHHSSVATEAATLYAQNLIKCFFRLPINPSQSFNVEANGILIPFPYYLC
jgi:hypothetical protein